MSLDVLSNYDLLHIIISFCDQTTICELLCSNKLFRVDKMNLSCIKVKGFYVHDLVKWLAIYQITTIETMTISDYILSNDHCMDVYQENCSCREDIIKTFRGLRIKNLTLRDVNLGYEAASSSLRWNPKPIERLELVNYIHHDYENKDDNQENREWISSMENLQDLLILHDYNQYQSSYMPSHKLLLTGIRNSQLKSLTTNIFYFVDDLKCLLQNSLKNENLKLFSFEALFDEDQTELLSLIKSKFPCCVITRY